MPTASLRAPEGYHLPAAMTVISKLYDTLETSSTTLFTKFGGHPCAAGFTTTIENLADARELLSEELAKQGQDLNSNQKSYFEIKNLPANVQNLSFRKDTILVQESEIDLDFISQIMSLDPFGQDFPFPQILFELKSKGGFRWIGELQNHLKIILENNINCTAFNIDKEAKSQILESTSSIWILAKVSQNTWNNSTKLELIADKVIIG
jgi:single-stranded DNA-specific DHH superfamily exonuclease